MPDAMIGMSCEAVVGFAGVGDAEVVVLGSEPLSIQAVNKETINSAARYFVTVNFICVSPR